MALFPSLARATRPGWALIATKLAASHTRRSAREAREERRQGQEEVEEVGAER
jgi:hypothetical protein